MLDDGIHTLASFHKDILTSWKEIQKDCDKKDEVEKDCDKKNCEKLHVSNRVNSVVM